MITDVVFGGLPSLFSGIIWIVEGIFYALYYVLTTIVPFLVKYIGIPVFILGMVLGLMFTGGHILFVILFIVGIYFYINGLFNIKLVSKTNVSFAENNNNEFKFK